MGRRQRMPAQEEQPCRASTKPPAKPPRYRRSGKGSDAGHDAGNRACTDDLDRPWLASLTTWSESSPCNMPLHGQAHSSREGVRSGGGTPFEFKSAASTDGIAMGHPGMKARWCRGELVSESIRTCSSATIATTLVGLGGLRQDLPGVMMAMSSAECASVFLLRRLTAAAGLTVATLARRGLRGVGSPQVARWIAKGCSASNALPARPLGACPGQYTRAHGRGVRKPWDCLPGSASCRPSVPNAARSPRPADERVMELVAPQHSATRHRHPANPLRTPQPLSPRRWFDQRRLASAGDRQRGRQSKFDLADVAEVSGARLSGRHEAGRPLYGGRSPSIGGVPVLIKRCSMAAICMGDCRHRHGSFTLREPCRHKIPVAPGYSSAGE